VKSRRSKNIEVLTSPPLVDIGSSTAPPKTLGIIFIMTSKQLEKKYKIGKEVFAINIPTNVSGADSVREIEPTNIHIRE